MSRRTESFPSETVRIDVPGSRFLSADGCRTLFVTLRRMCQGGGELQLLVKSRQVGYIRWARNAIIGAGDTVAHELYISRKRVGVWGTALIDRLDDTVLREAVWQAEQELHARTPWLFNRPILGPQTYATPALWSDATFAVDAAARATAQAHLVAPVEDAGLLSSGFVQITALGHGVINSAGLFAYVPETRAECSVTVRNAKGTASGWAGKCHRDWAALDAAQLVAKAVDKCQHSKDAVAIEPGRYTVVLEPQAVADFLAPLLPSFDTQAFIEEKQIKPWYWRTEDPVRYEGFAGVDALGYRPAGPITYIGQRVLDSRVTISADPVDPEMPFCPFANDGTPTRAVTWIEEGVLRHLSNDGFYGRNDLHSSLVLNNSHAFRMTGGPTSIAEMIASTERGLLVTRLVNVREAAPLDPNLLKKGNTSDGLWLIDKGRITTPVQNFRFRESPIFALNNLEAVGPAERVFRDPPAIVPALKIRDFSMTSLASAV